MNQTCRSILFICVAGLWGGFFLFALYQSAVIPDSILLNFFINLAFIPLIFLQIVLSKGSMLQKTVLTFTAVVLSPIFWICIGAELNLDLLCNDIAIFYTPAAFTITFLIFELSKEFTYRRRSDQAFHEKCPSCGSFLPQDQLFCNRCHKLTPKVYESYNRYPKKHHLDYVESIKHGRTFCPHCEQETGTTFSIGYAMASPLIVCSNCHEVYVNNTLIEWSAATPLMKLLVAIFGGPYLFLIFFAAHLVFFEFISKKAILILILSIVILHIVWFRFVKIDKFRESELRLKHNPNYPQLLTDMGYQHLDTKYHHLYRKNK